MRENKFFGALKKVVEALQVRVVRRWWKLWRISKLWKAPENHFLDDLTQESTSSRDPPWMWQNRKTTHEKLISVILCCAFTLADYFHSFRPGLTRTGRMKMKRISKSFFPLFFFLQSLLELSIEKNMRKEIWNWIVVELRVNL